MTPIRFCKFHGFGNAYIVMERSEIAAAVPLGDLANLMCKRNTGVGADGIAVLDKLDGVDADYHCEIVNPDGTFAGFSGNGTRCAVAYLMHNNLWTEPELRLQTRSGVKKYRVIEKQGPGEYWFEAEIGKPKFASNEIPAITERRCEAVVNEPIQLDGHSFSYSAVNVGNPVACIFVDDFDFDWRRMGRAMESHRAFPERANIVFIKIEDRENIAVRIWERGAGETAASGTCSSASAVVSAFMLKTGRNVRVHSEGGITDVDWRDDDEIVLTGSADLVFCGVWPG